ncbi:proteasome regulatory particle base subunit, partial [Ceratobasidium sp. 394]
WIYKNKEHGMLSAAASLGLSLLWDADVGLSQVDKYTYAEEEYIKAGALLATGILHSGIRTETDAVIALLADYIENPSVPLRTCASVGIGIAYAGAQRYSLAEMLLPLVADENLGMEVSSLAALSVGLIYVGSCNGEAAMTILQTMMEREEAALNEKWTRYMILGLALLYLGQQDASDATIEALRAVSHPVAKQALILVEICSFAGTSNVLKVQRMLHECNDHMEGDDTFQAFAVIGIALVAMGEDVGAEMSLRQFQHLASSKMSLDMT